MVLYDALKLLSECDLGAVVIDADHTIIDINAKGDNLLHGEGALIGTSLKMIAPLFCEAKMKNAYLNISFGEYLALCPSPEIEDLPVGTRLIVFRNARNDACHDMLMQVVNQIRDGVILCDEQERIFMLNDAAVKMDSLLMQDISGKKIGSIYTSVDGNELLLPQVIKNMKPQLNVRQSYSTFYGKRVEIVSNNYPSLHNGQILGAFSIMKDWTQIDRLNKKVIDLQERLLERTKSPKDSHKSKLNAKYQFRDIIHNSMVIEELIKKCKRCAKSDSSVMIYGETGTGKELFAQSIHNASQRANGPFLAINCAAIPENLLESLLFGTEKGAYTGSESRPGLLEQADGGTLLLDEINSMNLGIQSKLLRVLQDGVVRRVGGTNETHVNVRVLSNTNIPPYQAVEEKKIRQDLFYRLGVVNISIPPLRERKEDIAILAKHFILNYNKTLLKNVNKIDPDVLEIFEAYDWPGNVRELQHVIEHAMNILPDGALSITREILPDHISNEMMQIPSGESVIIEKTANERIENTIKFTERDLLIESLIENNGNITKTAQQMGISRQNLQYRIKRNDIDVHELMAKCKDEG